ncbi:MAG: hypothetical protein RLZZ524_843 [Pseudomonadota bacterium]
MSEPSSAIRPAVAIPIYKTGLTAAEVLSITRCADVLGRWPLYFIGPERLRPHLDDLCRRFGAGFQVKTYADAYFSGITGYNRLMRSVDFYRSFTGHSHLLIAQTDTLVIADELAAWCERDVSYVGAPWFVGGSEPTWPLAFSGVGNGGFSLRRLDDVVRVLQTPRRIPNFVKSRSGGARGPVLWFRRFKHEYWRAYTFEPLFPSANEDLFWGVLVPAACDFFKVPRPEDAIGFAFEVAPRHLYDLNANRLPFGCHAWERYDRQFWEEQLPWVRAAT